jgi:hypothetical protein
MTMVTKTVTEDGKTGAFAPLVRVKRHESAMDDGSLSRKEGERW